MARLDLGSVLIPMPEGSQLQVELTEGGYRARCGSSHSTVVSPSPPTPHRRARPVARGGRRARRLASQGLGQGRHQGRPVGPGSDRQRLRRRAFHRGRRLPLDNSLRRQRPARDDRRADRGGPGSVGGHRRSPRRHPAAGTDTVAGAAARADGGAAAGGGRPTGSAASRHGRTAQRADRAPSAEGSAMQQLRSTSTGG